MKRDGALLFHDGGTFGYASSVAWDTCEGRLSPALARHFPCYWQYSPFTQSAAQVDAHSPCQTSQ